MLASYVKDRPTLNLLWRAMRRTVTWGACVRIANRDYRGVAP